MFAVCTLCIIGTVSLLIYLIGTHVIAFSPGVIATAGIFAQAILVRRREAAVARPRPWRIWYTAGMGTVATLLIAGIIVLQSIDSDPIRYRSQVTLGCFLLFYFLVLPALVSGLIAKDTRLESNRA